MRLHIYFLSVFITSFGLCVVQKSASQYTLGLEALSDEFIQSLHNVRIALVTNQTGKDMRGHRNIDVLISRRLKPSLILVPEHGLDGRVPAGEEVADTKDTKTRIPVISLYGYGIGKNIDQKILNGIDLFMIDLQDCGMRHYTYISTLYTILVLSAQHNKRVVVLDRPNPLGDIMEGPLVEPSLYSFISIACIPVRHGMTMGELALYFNTQVLASPADLHVVRMKNYDRSKGLDGKMLAPLSPNIPSLQSCYGYSFLGILGEFKPFEIGIKVGKPFQVIMLPANIKLNDSQWNSLALSLKGYGINATTSSAYVKQQDVWYRGLQLQISDMTNIPAFQVLLTILDFAKASGLKLNLSELGDKAIGTKKLRAYVEGSLERAQLTRSINNGLNRFYKKAQTCFLYKPWPRILMAQ